MQQAPVKHNPLTFYLRALLYMVVAFFFRLLAVAPVAALFSFPAGSPWRWLALLCPLLMILWILPMRYSFAEALVQKNRGRFFSFDTALSAHPYWEKVLEGLLHALSVLKWSLPLLALCGYAYYCKDSVDAKTLMVSLMDLGKSVSGAWYAFANFFVTLFGGAALEPVAGSLVQGVYVMLSVLGLAVLVLLYGAVRNSCNRYIWVLASRGERPVRTEIRRRMSGRRWRQLGVALCNLVLCAPFLAVVGMTLRDVLGEASTALMMVVGYNGGSSLDVGKAFLPLALAFALLYMPLLPARRMLTAAFATRNQRHVAPRKASPPSPDAPRQQADSAQAAPSQEEPMPQAYVPDWVRAENEPSTPLEQTPADSAEESNGVNA